MTDPARDQRAALWAAGWTDEDVAAFAQTVATFRDGLPPRQRDAFDGIVAAAGAIVRGEDVEGYLVVTAIIGVLIAQLMPAIQKAPETPSLPAGVRAGATGSA